MNEWTTLIICTPWKKFTSYLLLCSKLIPLFKICWQVLIFLKINFFLNSLYKLIIIICFLYYIKPFHPFLSFSFCCKVYFLFLLLILFINLICIFLFFLMLLKLLILLIEIRWKLVILLDYLFILPFLWTILIILFRFLKLIFIPIFIETNYIIQYFLLLLFLSFFNYFF